MTRRRRGLLATLFPDSFPKAKVRKKKANGNARANVVARQNQAVYTSSGKPGPDAMPRSAYKRAKRVWPG